MNNISNALAYVEKLPAAIAGSGGHAATFRVACECVRRGLSEYEAREVMEWYNVHRCEPPWSEKELEHKVQSAFRVEKANGKSAPRDIAQVIDEHLKRPKLAPPVLPTEVPVYLMNQVEEEAWWARVFAERGIEDPDPLAPAPVPAAPPWLDLRQDRLATAPAGRLRRAYETTGSQ